MVLILTNSCVLPIECHDDVFWFYRAMLDLPAVKSLSIPTVVGVLTAVVLSAAKITPKSTVQLPMLLVGWPNRWSKEEYAVAALFK